MRVLTRQQDESVVFDFSKLTDDDMLARPDAVNHAQAHPDATLPTRAWAGDQTLHVAVAYANPRRWETRRRLFNAFRRQLSASPNIRLHVGEIAYGDRPFEVTSEHNPDDHQFRSVHQLWHKENLLNLVIQRFPLDWRYGAYLDADLAFTRWDFALETVQQLQLRDWVQMFSSLTDLRHDHTPLVTSYSFAYCLANKTSMFGEPKFENYGWPGRPGGCWAFRRDALARCGGLLDFCILGSGDYHMALGLAGMHSGNQEMILGAYAAAIRQWQERAAKATNKRLGYLDAHVIHHFHGSKKARAYGNRWTILNNHRYDPRTDIFRDEQGLWQLTEDKPDLREDIIKYFASRNEDDISP